MALSNLPEFNATVNAWAARHATGLSMDTVLRKLVLDALLGVVNYTPVDTGYLRFNWQVAVGRPPDGTRGEEGHEVPAMQTQVVPSGAVAGDVPARGTIPRFGIVYIANNVSYAQPVNDGTPRIPARLMVERTHADILAELAATVEVR